MPIDPSLMDKIVAESTKRMKGVQSIHSGSGMPPVFRIPYDEPELNIATFGGAPMGRMIRSWGSKSSCKTMLFWGLARQAQLHRSERFPDGLSVVYYNIEGTFDPLYVRDIMGVDISPEKLTVVEGTIIEDVSRNLDALLHARHLHIIDSASFAQSIHAFEAPTESQRMGLNARAWGMALQRAEEHMDKQENMICIIDQARANFKTGGEQAAGGYVTDHASSMTLHTRAAKKLYRVGGDLVETRPKVGNDPLSGTHRVDGREIEIEVEKSKVCKPFGKARLTFDIDALAFDKIQQYMKAGLFLGVIEQSGAYYKVPTMEKSINGGPKLRAHLAEDVFLVQMIEAAIEKYCKDAVYA